MLVLAYYISAQAFISVTGKVYDYIYS